MPEQANCQGLSLFIVCAFFRKSGFPTGSNCCLFSFWGADPRVTGKYKKPAMDIPEFTDNYLFW